MITKENFSSDNRTKVIGHSMYRICNTDYNTAKGRWYIHETYNDGTTWSQNNGFYRNSLEEVIDIFNLITKEKELVLSARKIDSPMSVEDAYEYYWFTYENGIFSLRDLQIKHRKGERCKKEWEENRNKSIYNARDYESYKNMQRSLKCVIKEILQSRLDSVLKPVPESIEQLDLGIEEKKITIAHRTLHSTCRRSLGSGDDFYHNLRAYLINRVEQASNGDLIVELDGADALSVAKIKNRKEFLNEKK